MVVHFCWTLLVPYPLFLDPSNSIPCLILLNGYWYKVTMFLGMKLFHTGNSSEYSQECRTWLPIWNENIKIWLSLTLFRLRDELGAVHKWRHRLKGGGGLQIMTEGRGEFGCRRHFLPPLSFWSWIFWFLPVLVLDFDNIERGHP